MGILVYAVVIWSCFATTRSLIKRARIHEDIVAVQYANMFRTSIIGFLVSGAFLSRAYFDYFFTLVACIAILRRVCQEDWENVEASEMELDEVTA